MTPSQAWDRFFWSVMITIFVGLVWLRLLDNVIGPCEGPGLLFALGTGIVFFLRGWFKAAAQKHSDMGEPGQEP